jgi:uncharacterized protein (TIGR03435 family)
MKKRIDQGMSKLIGKTAVCLALLAVLLMIPISRLFGQAISSQSGTPSRPVVTEATAPAYDIVSIKPNKSESGSVSIHSNDDSYSATNVSLKRLLEDAYGIKEDLVFGLPGWANSARFDVRAKIVEPDVEVLRKLSRQQRRSMIQQFLRDSFQLKAHTETKVLPLYEMILVKDGPKFKESAPEGSPEDKSPNGVERGGVTVYNTELTAHAVSLAILANMLGDRLHRTVADKTGLTGKYDLLLEWAPEDDQDASSESSAAPFFTALQEQLGLKLQPSKGPVDTLVVDHVEMPSED